MGDVDPGSRERRGQIGHFYAIPLEWIPLLALMGVTLVAITALLGWLLEIPLLYRFHSGLPNMLPSTAIGLLFCGASLYLQLPKEIRPIRRRSAQALALMCLLTSVFSAAESLQLMPGLDTLSRLPVSPESPQFVQTPHSSIGLLLNALALFLLGFNRPGMLITVQWLAIFALAMTIVILFSYIFSLTAYYSYSNVSSMALPTALGLTFLGNGILFARPHEGIMRLITSDAAGGLIVRRLIPIVVIAPLMIGWLMLAGQRFGLITPYFGLAMHEVLTTLLIIVFIIHIAITLNREEKLRHSAEEGARKHQSDLAHLVRINTMGEMVASIAHELKQPLTAISLYAANSKDLLATANAQLDDLRKQLDEIQTQSMRAAEIIRRTREFARKKEPQNASIQLNDLIIDVRDFLETASRDKGVQLLLELAPTLPTVKGDAVQLRQVLINIIHNAIESMEANVLKPKQVTVQTCLTEAGEVRTDITDTGAGMDDMTLSHIFESFFTTKGDGGMGMGLSISRSIVEAHGGQLWARSAPGKGATFTFTLPQERTGPHKKAQG